ncbi:MAG: putative 2OG-Fe(II) oxygenase [Pseudomonadota bacterium]
MPIQSYDVQPLFATPIFRADISHAITADQILYVQELKMVTNRENQISEDLYIFRHPQLKRMAEAVQEALDIYARDVMGIRQTIEITQSWALMNQPGVGMHPHAHSNSIVSGSLYYCDLPQPVSRVFFDRHIAYQQIELPPLPDKQNLYNTPANVITPKQGEIILFPSNLNHMIEANAAAQPRRAIAINSFVRGTVGNYRDVSELTV